MCLVLRTTIDIAIIPYTVSILFELQFHVISMSLVTHILLLIAKKPSFKINDENCLLQRMDY